MPCPTWRTSLRPRGIADAWSFTAPVIDMPVYLGWLRARLDELGGTVTRMSMAELPETDGRRGQLRRARIATAGGGSRAYARCAGRW